MSTLTIPPIPAFYIYFSIWNLLLVLFHKYTYKYYNLLLACIVIVITMIICVYMHPKYLKINYINNPPRKFENKLIIVLIDFLVHWIPLIFVAVKYGKYYMTNPYTVATGVTVFVLAFYGVAMNAANVYDMDPNHMFVAFTIATAIFYTLKIWVTRMHFKR